MVMHLVVTITFSITNGFTRAVNICGCWAVTWKTYKHNKHNSYMLIYVYCNLLISIIKYYTILNYKYSLFCCKSTLLFTSDLVSRSLTQFHMQVYGSHTIHNGKAYMLTSLHQLITMLYSYVMNLRLIRDTCRVSM